MSTASTTPQQVVIETPDDRDIDVVAGLFKEDMDALGVETGLGDQKEVARAVIAGTHADPRECLCWVARSGDEDETTDTAGLIVANFNWSLKFAGRALWIETLYVTPSHRRRGIGAQLVETMLDWAEANDIRGIDLEAYRGNTPASILYRSLGFRRLGRERFYYRFDGSGYL